jgi:hypothetical protein
VTPPLLRLTAFSVGIGLFRYLSFQYPSRSEFAVSFSQKLIVAVPAFVKNVGDFFNVLEQVYTALLFLPDFCRPLWISTGGNYSHS